MCAASTSSATRAPATRSIRREMRQLEGAYYDGQKIQTSKRRVDRLQYFSEVDVETPAGARAPPTRWTSTCRSRKSPPEQSCSGFGFSSTEKVILSGSVIAGRTSSAAASTRLSVNTSKVNRNIGVSLHRPVLHGRRRQPRLRRLQPALRRAAPQHRQLHHRHARRRRALRLSADRDRSHQLRSGGRIRPGIAVFSDSPQRFIDFVNQYRQRPHAQRARDDRLDAGPRDSAIWTTKGYTDAGERGGRRCRAATSSTTSSRGQTSVVLPAVAHLTL